MKARLQKWGNSLATRLPKSFAEEIGLADGSPIDMSLEGGAIVIKPDRERNWDLETLLAGITGENVHPAWESDLTADPAESAENALRPGGEERR